jgi:hypothetical protein
MHSWNLEKIYSGEVSGKGPIGLTRHLVREYTTKADVKKAITSVNPDLKVGTDKRGAIRFQPKTKVKDNEEFINKFFNTLDEINLFVTDVINPGEPGSPSSKFKSYRVRDMSDNEFIITLGGGAHSNKGMEYERNILNSVNNYFNNPEDEQKPAILDNLENFLDVSFKDVDKGRGFDRQVRRPLTDKGPSKKGDEISDLTLIDTNDKPYYISLKNVGGKTISNAGAKGMFDIDSNNVKFVNRERDSIGKKLLEAGGVNIDRVIAGLEDYITKTPSVPGQEEKIKTTDLADIDKLTDFLGSAFDYGYIYVKQKNVKNDLEIADLTNKDKLYDFIGDIKEVEVKYPYYKDSKNQRKHISIIINTTKGVYSFDIRNASGGDIPNQINLVKGKSNQEITANKINLKSLSSSEQELSDNLSNI